MRGLLKTLFWGIVLLVVIYVWGHSSIGLTFSPNFRYLAVNEGVLPDVHSLVVDLGKWQGVFKTYGEYSSPNDIKSSGFSPDSSKFAAAYHYYDNGPYTWIGIWSTETGEFLTAYHKQGWVTDLSGVFDQ